MTAVRTAAAGRNGNHPTGRIAVAAAMSWKNQIAQASESTHAMEAISSFLGVLTDNTVQRTHPPESN
jgi:hypothetical protein